MLTDWRKLFILIATILILCAELCYGFIDGFSAAAIGVGLGGMGAFYAGKDYINCKLKLSECCDDNWIAYNHNGLVKDLSAKVFGQPFVSKEIPKIINGFIRSDSRKPLVLGFHGWTGGEKNYVADIIAANIYTEGIESRFIHKYSGKYDFPSYEPIEKHEIFLRNELKEHTRVCGRSLFIFDEIDDMPQGLLDAITTMLDFNTRLDGLDFRRNIFLILSNAGGESINKVAYQFYKDGRSRESITLEDVETNISERAFNSIGGLKDSQIIRKHLIDFYVPFLPLEKEHVKQCVRDEFKRYSRKPQEHTVQEIADGIEYVPKEAPIYSRSGCKQIPGRVQRYI